MSFILRHNERPNSYTAILTKYFPGRHYISHVYISLGSQGHKMSQMVWRGLKIQSLKNNKKKPEKKFISTPTQSNAAILQEIPTK